MVVHRMIPDFRRTAALNSLRELGWFSHLEWYEEIDSTNRSLHRRIKDGSIALPALIVTDVQTQGAGRGGNRWFSPPGCLMFSVGFSSRDLLLQGGASLASLPLQVGLSVAQAIAPLVRSQPMVKWPNDVYIEDRKVCGILMETSYGNAGIGDDFVIVGIGINCHVRFDAANDEVRRNAVSLHEVVRTSGEVSSALESVVPESVLLRFLQVFRENLVRFQEDPESFMQAWRTHDWLAERWVSVQQPHREVIGRVVGIDRTGGLCLIDSLGIVHTILSGTVRLIPTDAGVNHH